VEEVADGSSTDVSRRSKSRTETDIDNAVPVLSTGVLDKSWGCLDGSKSTSVRKNELLKFWKKM